jgi:hypothetical protein
LKEFLHLEDYSRGREVQAPNNFYLIGLAGGKSS